MLRTLALLTFLGICLSSYASTDADSFEEDSTLEFIKLDYSAASPQATLTLTNLTNSTVIDQLSSKKNITTPNRIVGGRPISISEAPWQTAVIQANVFVCGGSLLSSYFVLTAAHCVYGNASKPHSVRAGSNFFKQGGQLRKVDRVAYHGGFNPKTSVNDIALLRMAKPFKLNANIQLIRLPTSNLEPSTYFISGWGLLSENGANPAKQLHGINVYLQQRTTCAAAYRDKILITENQLCASAPNQDTCQGDSGGALVSQGTQYGIASYGFGCARPKYPGVYTKVYKYLTWITAVKRSLSPHK